MDEDFGFFIEKPEQVIVYEKMLAENASIYFDVDDFEQIIDYYQNDNKIDQAIIASEYAINLHPTSIEVRLRQARLMALKNDEKAALKIIEEIESIEHDNIDIFLTKGAIYSILKKYEKAIEEYNKVLPKVDDPDFICCNIAFEYENMGNYNKTLEYLGKALEYNPNNYVAMYEAAYCFELLSLNEESIDFFKKHIDKHPYSIEAWFNLGISYINASLQEKAIEAFDFCLAIDDNYKPANMQKAVAFSNLADFKSAIECYKASINNDEQEHPMISYYIGECYEKMEKYEEAVLYYRKAVEIDPEITDAWIGIGVSELEAGNFKTAINAMHKGLSLDPENISYLCLLADAYLGNFDKDNCSKYFEKALLIDSEDVEVWVDYSEAMIAFGDYKEALCIIDRALEYNEDNLSLTVQAVICLYMLGRTNEAEFLLEDILLKDKNDKSILRLEKYPGILKTPSIIKLIDLYKE